MILRSKYLICSPELTVEDGAIAITDDGRIEAVGRFGSVKRSHSGKIVDRGDEILSPGFVNAHAHLALSSLKGIIPPPQSFCDWLYQVATTIRNWSEDDYFDSVLTGVNLSLEGGTTSVVEIACCDESIQAALITGIRKFLLFEVLGFEPELTEEQKGKLEDRLVEHREGSLLRTGVTPHAPYTVSKDLLSFCKDKAQSLDKVLAIHLAETTAEAEFIESGTGEIVAFKDRLGLPAPDWSGTGKSPVHYLDDLGLLYHRSVLAHCNYLSDADLARIASSQATVVYCPRSHRYFGHPEHPLPKLLAAGVPVALGTDSLASNDGLSILDEMKYVKQRFPELENETIYAMGTTAAVPALGAVGEIGLLQKDAYADVLAIDAGQCEGNDILGMALEAQSRVTLTMIGGRILFDGNADKRKNIHH